VSDTTATPVLRYFDCRSRGQALRFALCDAGVEFEDRRLPVAGLGRFREEGQRSGVGGPFASLPVLEWGGHTVAQTLVIAGYLAGKLGPRRGDETPEERAFLEMVAHAAHLDMQVPYSQLLWLPAECPRERLLGRARSLLTALDAKLGQLEALLVGCEARFFGGTEPVVADCFVYESLSRGAAVFGAPFEKRLRRVPRLSALGAAMQDRPGIAAALERVPFAVTASPSEVMLRERLAGDEGL